MLILDASDVASLLDYRSCIEAVEDAFRRQGRGDAGESAVLGVHVRGGGFHVKAAALELERPYFAAKTNANFPANPRTNGLPTIQGLVLLFDGACGTPLALLDSVEITLRRTAAATAVAARHLARRGADSMVLCGCGVQGRAHLDALREVLALRRVWLHDVDRRAAERLAEEVGGGIEAEVIDTLSAARDSDVWITCTTSYRYILHAADVQPGSFVAGVGADNPEKRELAPDLLARSRVVVDLLDQCVVMGDLHHAIAAGAMTAQAVHGELGEVVAGKTPGRTAEDEIFVFDSTGTGLQDVAAAALVYERAVRSGTRRE